VATLLIGSGVAAYQLTHPNRILGDRYPSLFQLTSEDFTVTTDDGVTIAGWFIPSKLGSRQPTIIVLHEYEAGKYDVIDWTYFLAEKYNLVFFDWRGHGASSGIATLGSRESRDLSAVMDYLKTKPAVDPGQLALMGYGFGASMALVNADHPSVKLVVADSLLRDFSQLATPVKKNRNAVYEPFYWLARVMVRPFIGRPPVEPLAAVTNHQAKLFLMHVQHDSRISFSNSQAVFDAASDPKELWSIAGTNHVVVYTTYRQEYRQRVEALLQEAFQP